ncbi:MULTISPECIES: DoxX family protein [Pontibacillus]|uniref:DoxX family protein n=1 Tax=Pontibacillus chungwhensis TaxID=265426 RepID=A0ABY8UW44_9BACI|nr:MULTISPECIES: DoxX family protein [Pontibacillus]MCD5323353.1 DoxX family protein [Pontibacillus sp. HN14]WIF96734.1 DoxX family protein [Pontibacillus chungwhensis]
MDEKIGWGLFLGRLVLGVIMVAHGCQKLGHMEDAVQLFHRMGQPAWLAYVTAIIETGGGLLLVVGLFVVPAAMLLGLTMIGAIVLVHLPQGLIGGFEFPLALLGISMILAMTGSDKLSLAEIFKNRKET